MTRTPPNQSSRLLSADEGQHLLQRVHQPFVEAHRHGWSQWLRLRELCRENDANDLVLPIKSTTRANFVNNHCTARIDERIVRGDGVAVTSMGGLFTAVTVTQAPFSAFVRFKALDRGLKPSNVQTNVQSALSKQEWPEDLFSYTGLLHPATVVTCGYTLTPDQSEIEGIYVCCHYKRNLLWFYPIDEAGEAGAVIEQMPLDPTTPTYQPRIVSAILPETADREIEQ